jgi:hypothetical protein
MPEIAAATQILLGGYWPREQAQLPVILCVALRLVSTATCHLARLRDTA